MKNWILLRFESLGWMIRNWAHNKRLGVRWETQPIDTTKRRHYK